MLAGDDGIINIVDVLAGIEYFNSAEGIPQTGGSVLSLQDVSEAIGVFITGMPARTQTADYTLSIQQVDSIRCLGNQQSRHNPG